jgi:hypothetical protein
MGMMPSGHLGTQTELGIADKNITKQFQEFNACYHHLLACMRIITFLCGG